MKFRNQKDCAMDKALHADDQSLILGHHQEWFRSVEPRITPENHWVWPKANSSPPKKTQK